MSINIDSLDGIYLTGVNNSFGVKERILSLLKYNIAGELQWNRTWGGNGGVYFNVRVIIDSLNNIYLTGGTENKSDLTSIIYLIKYNSSGHLEWNRTWGGDGDSYVGAIALDSLNNIYLTGSTDSYSFLLKFDISGDLKWNTTLGGIKTWSQIVIDSADDIYISGIISNWTGTDELHLLKYNNTGYLQWNQTLSGINYALAPRLAIDSSDNIYIYGSNYSVEYADLFLLKYDLTGKQLWNSTWGGILHDFAFKIAIDSSDNIYIGGEIHDGISRADSFIVKYDNSGMRLWNQTWDAGLHDITVDSLGSIYLAGFDQVNMIILKYDRFGSLMYYTSWGEDQSDYATGIALDSLGNVYVAGTTRSYGAGESDMCIVKFVESSESIIPGYDLVLLILILSGVSIITIISRFNNTLFRKKLNV